MNMNKMTFLYIWDFCKFLFELNATQTTKINLIKYTVVIFLASSLFIWSFIYSVRLKRKKNILGLLLVKAQYISAYNVVECVQILRMT